MLFMLGPFLFCKTFFDVEAKYRGSKGKYKNKNNLSHNTIWLSLLLEYMPPSPCRARRGPSPPLRYALTLTQDKLRNNPGDGGSLLLYAAGGRATKKKEERRTGYVGEGGGIEQAIGTEEPFLRAA